MRWLNRKGGMEGERERRMRAWVERPRRGEREAMADSRAAASCCGPGMAGGAMEVRGHDANNDTQQNCLTV